MTDPRIAIVGATGAVGNELLATLERREVPLAGLTLLASPRSAGKSMTFRGESIPVEVLGPDSFRGVDVALFSAGGATSREYASVAVDAGAVVVDNSSAFRMDANSPTSNSRLISRPTMKKKIAINPSFIR